MAGATGASGVYVVRIAVAYKQGQETVQIQSHSMVEINALVTKKLNRVQHQSILSGR